MARTYEGPLRYHGAGRKHVQYDRPPLAYRIPPAVRITGEQAGSGAKRIIVAGAARGIIPARVAAWLIQRGGMRHV